MSANERPGVYTSYRVSSTLAGRAGNGAVGLAACVASGTVGQATELNTYAEAVAAYGENCAMTKLVKVLFQNGAPKIIATPVLAGSGTATGAAYTAAFALLMTKNEVRCMVCDSREASVHALLKNAIEGAASESCKYRIGVAEMSGTAAALASAASALNSERIALVAPAESAGTPGAVAAAVAGIITGSPDPALPLNGAVLAGLSALSGSFSDADIAALVTGGVTPVETVGGEISVVRAVTTRSTTAGVADATWRELATILIVDDVIPAVRDSLRSRFARVKNTAQTRGAIRTQVILELERKLAAQIIESYAGVTAEAAVGDPTVCDVSFEFTVAHGLNKINLVAHITV
ncbi:MAG: phage tail sheath protein [Oscillospiraceae bacterium]